MKYGNIQKTKYQEKNGIKINERLEIDMSPEKLKQKGFKSKRGYDGIIEFKITHLFDDVFVGLDGSLRPIMLPYEIL